MTCNFLASITLHPTSRSVSRVCHSRDSYSQHRQGTAVAVPAVALLPQQSVSGFNIYSREENLYLLAKLEKVN